MSNKTQCTIAKVGDPNLGMKLAMGWTNFMVASTDPILNVFSDGNYYCMSGGGPNNGMLCYDVRDPNVLRPGAFGALACTSGNPLYCTTGGNEAEALQACQQYQP